MIPVFLFLLFLSMTAAPLRAADSENQIETPLIFGDILPSRKRNALPCTATGCKWPKAGDYVNIPVYISRSYSNAERNIIIRGLMSFHESTCIRFVMWTNHQDYIYIYPGSGCWSNLGYQGGLQLVSLKKGLCLFHSTVQHELNHALGFHHEISRSDRDTYIQILTQNIRAGREDYFEKIQTNNLGTPYDFNSVMHYNKYTFTRNGQPTTLSKANPSLDFGRASSMSNNDIARINKLYGCS